VVLGGWLDLIILEVFFNLCFYDSMILHSIKQLYEDNPCFSLLLSLLMLLGSVGAEKPSFISYGYLSKAKMAKVVYCLIVSPALLFVFPGGKGSLSSG